MANSYLIFFYGGLNCTVFYHDIGNGSLLPPSHNPVWPAISQERKGLVSCLELFSFSATQSDQHQLTTTSTVEKQVQDFATHYVYRHSYKVVVADIDKLLAS